MIYNDLFIEQRAISVTSINLSYESRQQSIVLVLGLYIDLWPITQISLVPTVLVLVRNITNALKKALR